jgi:phosphatidylglycerophosphatase B
MDKLKKQISENLFVYVSSITCFVILVLIVYIFPIGFSEYRNTDFLAPLWYWITLTGGVYGSSVIILILLIYLLLIHFKKNSKKIKNAFLFIGIILLIQLLSDGATQFYFKDVFKSPRPSQLYFAEKAFAGNNANEFYEMTPENKSEYMKEKINDSSGLFEEVYPPVLNSWVNESGYSFPSGHAQTAFLLGTIMAFIIFKTNSKKYFIFIPLAWAILVGLSRVVIGIHFPFDVTAGAFIGLAAGLITISVKRVNDIFK